MQRTEPPGFLPEPLVDVALAGLLTSSTRRPSRVSSGLVCTGFYLEVTAAGTVPDLHRIPFSFHAEMETKSAVKIRLIWNRG